LASTLSVFAVGAVRGIGDRLHQVAIVDAVAGSREAFATAYFGVKAPIDKEMDFWLPGNWESAREPEASDNSLRPLPAGADIAESQTRFADPAKYRLIPASAVVEDVRVRATLKRFEGRWQGPLDGDVAGVVHMRDRQVADGSFLVNNLGFPLRNALLLVPLLDPGAAVGRRDDTKLRDTWVDVYELGTLTAADATVDLTLLCVLPDDPTKRRDAWLRRFQGSWSAPFRSLFEGFAPMQERSTLGQEENALLLLSMVQEFDPAQHSNTMQAVFGPRTWSQDRMRQLDVSDQLTAGKPASGDAPAQEGSALLVGFADDPGPLRLFSRTGDRDFQPLDPEPANSWSMWRIRIPLVRLDRVEPGPPESDATTQ
jgi:hypothetical protein